jgi:hypothetical protein
MLVLLVVVTIILLICVFHWRNGAKFMSVEPIESWSSMPITDAPYCENDCRLSGAEWDEKAIHSAYSLDLAPSDFYLFGYVKQLSGGHHFPDRGAHFLTRSKTSWGVLTKLPWIGLFSLGWRDSSGGLQSLGTTLSKQTFRVKCFYW